MSSQDFIVQKDKLEFRQIVLEFIKKILELNLKVVPKEHKLAFTETKSDAVRGLSDVLLPFYDNKMKEAYSNYEQKFKELDQSKIKINKIEFLRRIHRELFRQLNSLMGRQNYLKARIYSEGEDDEIVDTDK